MPPTSWQLGLVSNCWKVQLDAGIELESLIDEALRCGLSVIELRQTCLGRFENGPMFVPDAEQLAELPQRFPRVQFNVALSLPCLSGEHSTQDSLFQAGRAAAVALAGDHPPHLRLVDLQTRPSLSSESAVKLIGERLAELTQSLIDVGGILSIEHAAQPWTWFCSVLHEARERLREHRLNLRLCFDPCNLLLTEPFEDVADIVESVLPEEVSMIHIKQRRDGRIQTDVGDGDLNWVSLLKLLTQRDHTAPLLFETAPSADVWSRLEQTMDRLNLREV